MKRVTFFCIVWTVFLTVEKANAGAAVAAAPHLQLATSYGGTIQQVTQRALSVARKKYGGNVRILAATDRTGFGAVAVARPPNGVGWIVGVALGRRSATEADALAIEQCRKAGGIKPKVKWGFWG
jgi:hypothetical protein